jgi:hypothetical protein
MNKLFRRGAAVGALSLAVVAAGCKTDLTSPNLNNPDLVKVLGSGTDVQNVIGNAFATWWNAEQNVNALAMSVTSDNVTANFGNFGMRFNNQEPRIAYANLAGGSDEAVALSPWQGYYSALGSVNDGLKAVDAGISISNAATTDQYVTLAKFIQGVSLVGLANYFDQAFVVTEKSDAATLALQPYAVVRDSAIAKLDAVIAATAGKTYSFPAQYVEDLGLTAAKLNAMANSYAARALVLNSRTGTQNTAVNWGKVLQYASKGISAGTPFNVQLSVTSANSFGNNYTAYANTESWTRVDMRIIQAMDSTSPLAMTSTTVPPKATTADARYGTGNGVDFEYCVSAATTGCAPTIGDPNRGVWMLSPYRYRRYLYMARGQPNAFLGITPTMIAAENDLMWAEALIRTGGDKALAVQLINNTRVNRGKLPPATIAHTTAQLLSYIRYERLLELYGTSVFPAWGDARRDETIKVGAPRSMPVPARELQTLGIPVYTFGGAGISDGH